MPIRVACPACAAVLNAPDSAGGKTADCPKCGAAMLLPIPQAVPLVDSRELIEDKPRRRRPDRRRYDDDEPEPAVPLGLYIGGGIGALVVVLLLALWAGGAFRARPGARFDAPEVATANDSSKPGNAIVDELKQQGTANTIPPDGWQRLTETDYRIFVPIGTAKENSGLTADQQRQIRESLKSQGCLRMDAWSGTLRQGSDEFEFKVRGIAMEKPTFGRTEAVLLATAEKWEPWGLALNAKPPRVELMGRAPVTIGTATGVEFRTRDAGDFKAKTVPAGVYPPGSVMEGTRETKNRIEESRAAEALKHRRFFVVRVFTDGTRLFVVSVSGKRKEPDSVLVKTYFESFELR